MKDAIGGSLLFNLMIIFIIVLMLFFVGSINYSKAYKVKNKIINIIEKYDEYNVDAQNEIDAWLGDVAKYKRNTGNADLNSICRGLQNQLPEGYSPQTIGNTNYQYCIYQKEVANAKTHKNQTITGTTYLVVTFMYLDLPIINNLIRVPIKSETKTLQYANNT